MIKRDQKTKILELSKQYFAIAITGPRQSGKTTLAKNCFPNYKYYNLEDPNTRALIESDPKSFVNVQSEGTIFDEVQKYPELLSYIQITVDESKKEGQFILTGSENLLLSEKISQTLAGRVAIFTLLPLSAVEIKKANLLTLNTSEILLKGFYPRLYEVDINSSIYYSNYISTYIERDVRLIKNISDISNFQRFMRLLAGRVGQILNVESLSNDLGIDNKTVNSWISILEATYICFRLQPYFKNFGKRVIKSPKIYFYDTGVLAYLLGIDSSEEMETHFARGSIFENLVILEQIKNKLNNLETYDLYFWRDSNQNEIDLLKDKGNEIDIFEIKSSKTYKTDFISGLSYLQTLVNSPAGNAVLVYDGNENMDLIHVKIRNWREILV